MARKNGFNKILTKKEKLLWNEAVAATAKEVLKYDGLVPNDDDRKALSEALKKRVSYKKELEEKEWEDSGL